MNLKRTIIKINFLDIAINALFLFFIFSLTITVILIICKKKGINKKIPLLGLMYHSFFSFIWYYITRDFTSDADAIQYYLSAVNTTLNIKQLYGYGSDFIIFILYPLVKYLKLSFFSAYMIFNIAGFFGIFIFYLTMKELIGEDRRANIYLIIAIFIPGLNYWTSMIGKDALMILSLSIVFYSIINIGKRLPFLFIGMLLMGHVRPHMLIIVLFAFALALMVAKNVKMTVKLFIIILLIPLMIKSYFVFIDYVHISQLDYGVIEDYTSGSPTGTRGGSTIDISNYNIFIRMLCYLYRPLFFDVYNITTLISSFENLVYLIISISMIRISFIKYLIKEGTIFMRFNIFYIIPALIILSSSTANLGTAFRQKNMITISLLAMFILYTANKPQIRQFASNTTKKLSLSPTHSLI